MVKQAIFNLVGPGIAGAHVLDLFAGSGALGIEALSRGAANVTFVDHQPRGLAILRQNLDVLGLKERAHVVRADVVRWLDASPDEIKRAGLVMLDPPYDDLVLDRALKVLDRAIQVHGALGLTDRSPLGQMYAMARGAHIYDGPDEVHRMVVSRRILKSFADGGTWRFDA